MKTPLLATLLRKTSLHPLPAGVLVVSVIISLLASSVPPLPAETGPMTRVLIGVTHQPGPGEEDLVRQAGGQVNYTYHLVPAIAATVPASAIARLQAHPSFTTVHPDLQVRTTDLELDAVWGVKRVGAGTVHAAGNKGARVRIAILDTGIEYNHPDLRPNFAGGRDFVNNDSDPLDDNGHGTHVAGTIAARDDGKGVVGVAPEAQIYALKIQDSTGVGDWSHVIAALEWAVDNRIQVTNNSYGSPLDPGPIVKEAFDAAAAAGVVSVVAAGNSGAPFGVTDAVDFPARYGSTIAVGATNPDNTWAFFSSVGAPVKIAAPGTDVFSTFLGGLYAMGSGTSMATPHVVGAAALVIASGIADTNRNARINDEVERRLLSTADDFGAVGRDPQFGFGELNAPRAVGLPGPPNSDPVVFISNPLFGSSFSSGTPVLFNASAVDIENGALTPSLVWTSNLDGEIGSGGSFLRTLTDGSHSITASVRDSAGQTGAAAVSITVGAPSLPPLSVSVTSNRLAYQDRDTARITALVSNGTILVPDARVIFIITTANGSNLFGGTTTDAEGVVRFQFPLNTSSGGAGLYRLDTTSLREGFAEASSSLTFLVR